MEKIVELALRTGTLEELLCEAETAGIEITTEEAFLRQVKKEWLAERKRQISKDYSGRMLPETLPCREIDLGGMIYQVYGIAHYNPPTPDYVSLVHRTIAQQGGLFLAEQNVARYFDISSATEIIDHAAPKYWLTETLAEGYWHGIQTIIFTPTELINKASRCYSKQKRLKMQEFVTLFCPPEFHFTFPPQIALQLKDRQASPKYNSREQRSAYMAEFLRRSSSTPNIIVGQGHVPEIEYFLKNGCKDQRIVELAQEHHEFFKRDPHAFHFARDQISYQEYLSDFCAAFAGAGTILSPLVMMF
ncbi:hypothetical protein J4210_04585 [Candidatus Woesearchaeota archaeon]|nr:hypothetical protein [Candidatus Woesearchaeota archaeon]